MSSDPAKLALSPALASRIHRVAPAAEGVASPDGAGEFVLYWMRTAVRAHDNPALEVALAEGRRMGLPVFVYHALSERYPYASDRHHRFILEGARDVAREMAERRIGYGFHLERPEHRGPHLVTLARRAGRVVTEDMPVAPLDRWTRKLARRSGREVWAVDSACLVPMRTVDRAATTRAFRFRKATRHAREVALRDGAPAPVDSGVGAPGAVAGVATEPGIPFVPGGLPFEPVSLPDADLAALIAACEIDHGVGPVPHTSGGSVAGYARWEAFRDQGLARYAGTRNNPLVPGVSRMSAYLHYGHVSPWRIAREAAAVGGKGGEKYLDELLVWRELAYAFCAHRPEHDTVAALPDWARQTLAVHEDDPRERLSWETLARAETGDALWDAAQRSLLVHGELHNNVRMTWGKALLGWTRDAGEALERLVDLNHRFALDGRDPASFGGILWCLGQFDRPFTPERPVLGTVRSRSTETHARRLDVDEYRRRVEQPAWPGAPRVAVVGGGLSGLMAARTLRDHGLDVTVFDKGRRPGGRASTREHGATRFDHGAQYFTIRDRRMRPLLESWLQDGVVAEWPGRLVRYRDGRVESAREGARYVGVPGMIDLASHLSRELDVRRGVRVGSVERPEGWRDEVPPSAGGGPGNGRNAASERAGRWLLRDESGGNLGRFDEVVVALPPPQAVPLLDPAPALQRRVGEVGMMPCWAVMVTFEAPVPVDFDGAFLEGDPLSWVCRNTSKPGRPPEESWVLHGGPGWSETHLERDPEEVAEMLMGAFASRFGPLPDASFRRGHRWRYAQPRDAAGVDALHDARLGIGVCGDAFPGGRVEGALLSGRAVAGRILAQAPPAAANPLGEARPGTSEQLPLL